MISLSTTVSGEPGPADFRRDVRYLVPVFQRRYKWEQEKQWEPLWNDVLEVVDAYVKEAETEGTTPRGDALPVHFLGAIVVKLVPFGAGEIELRKVIDGQQRLTTIQLLIAAAASALRRLGGEAQAHVLGDLIGNRPYMTKGDQDAAFKNAYQNAPCRARWQMRLQAMERNASWMSARRS